MRAILVACLAIAATLFVAGQSQAQYGTHNGVQGQFRNHNNFVIFTPTNRAFLSSYVYAPPVVGAIPYGNGIALAPGYAPSACGTYQTPVAGYGQSFAPVYAPSYGVGYGFRAFNPFFFNRTIVIRR